MSPARNNLRHGSSRLSARLMLLFLLLSIVPLVVVGYLAFDNSRRTIEQDTVNRLLSITILKEGEMNRWIGDKEQSVRELAERRVVQEHTAVLNAYEPVTPEHVVARIAIREEHLHPALEEEAFLELSLLRPGDGLILASTEETHEGQHREDESYFVEGKDRTYVQNVHYSPTLGEAAMTISTPVHDSDGDLIAVLAGRVDLAELSKIMTQGSGLSESEHTYMVNESGFLVTEARFESGGTPEEAIRTEGVADCLARKPFDTAQDGGDDAASEGQHPYGVGMYADYRGVPVIGVYRWIPEWELCILTEVNQSEAFAPIAELRATITGIGAVVALIVAVMAVWFARTITEPVHQLVKGAEEIGKGNLQHRMKTGSRDEIGQLARAFNRMAQRLHATTASRDELNQEIVERTRAQETLRRSEREKAAILDSLSDLVIYHDTEMNILWANRAASESAGLTYEQLKGGHCYEIWHQRSSTCVGCPVVKARETGRPQEAEIRTPDGRSWSVRGYPVVDTEGVIEGIVETTQDITERRQTQDALRRRAREMEMLQATVLDITGPHALPTLLQTIVERAAHLLDAPAGGLYLCDPEQQQVRCVVSYNTPRDYTEVTLKYGEGAAGTVAQTGEPLIIDDYRVWSKRAGVHEDEQPFTAVLSVPMIWQGHVTGVIHVLEEGERRHFIQADLELLTLFANHAVIAVENARLYEQAQAEIAQRKRAEENIARTSEALRRRTAQLEALRQVSLELTAQLDLDALLQSIIIHATELLDGTGSGIALHRPEGDLLEAVVSVGDTSVPIGTTFRRGEGLAGKILETGDSLAVDDYRRWEGRMLTYEGPPITAVAGVPIRWGPAGSGGELLGVLIIQDDAPRTFSASDVERLRLLATQAAIAIRNARLFEETEEHVAELEALQRTSLELASSLDPSSVLNTVVESALTLMEADDCHIYLYDESTDTFTFGAALWEDGSHEPAVQSPRPDGLTATVVREGRPVIISDAQHHPLYTTPEAQPWGLRSIFGFPLKRANRALGVLTVAFLKPHALRPGELRALGVLADQAAIAIENARLYEEALQDAQTRAVLLREVNHRVKNNLTAIIGLIYAARARPGVDDQAAHQTAMNELIGQVRGLATAHSMLSDAEWTPVLLGDLALQIINNVLRALPSGKWMTMHVPPSPVRVTPDEAHNLALVINELATNATKYALGERPAAHIVFRSAFEDGMVHCEFRDDGPGYPDDVLDAQRHTSGLDLIGNILRDSLNGTLSLHNDEGAVASIQFEAQIGKGEGNSE